MIYKDFQNLRLPMLGFGSMRLPLLPGGGDGDVDEAAVAEMVALAMERGANYFDTAYGYHNGNSERVMGRVLSRYPRESWLLASKFPGYDVSNIRPDRVEATNGPAITESSCSARNPEEPCPSKSAPMPPTSEPTRCSTSR